MNSNQIMKRMSSLNQARQCLVQACNFLPPKGLSTHCARFSTIFSSAQQSSQYNLTDKSAHPKHLRCKASYSCRHTSPSSRQFITASSVETTRLPLTSTPASNTPISDKVRTLLPLLKAQPFHYITIHIHGRPYLVSPGDVVRLPFRMPNVKPGDILRLNRATHLGSRDYTLRASEPNSSPEKGHGQSSYLDESLFICRAIVMGTESEPLRVMEKTKRRQRHVKSVKSKHKYTILRITELEVTSIGQADGISGNDEHRSSKNTTTEESSNSQPDQAKNQVDTLDTDMDANK